MNVRNWLKISFDGDQLNMTLLLDNWMAGKMERLAPPHWALSLSEPCKISNKLKLQGPVVETIANWLEEPIA